MRFNPQILDEIRARVPVSQVVGRKVALKRKGREFTGLSPFKAERTPSFFVNDHKGFYHCFASGEHGDIFTFLIKTEGLSFPEAVERLAEEAGVALPKPDARDAERQDERQRLLALMEVAQAFFVAELHKDNAAEARRYVVQKRGLKRATIERFGIGYAPNSKHALKEHLAAKGFSLAEMVLSGMLIGGEDIAVPYDRFRHRIMFPIADLKGRIIAFGGRALDAEQPAKYLNSPETPLFHKGHVLFNAHRARQPAHDKGRMIAVEGYMDVVALDAAGFGEGVAPLGTALTEDQVRLMWRVVPEPTLCFDGDSAGQKAAYRAVDTVIPHLKPGCSVAFALLPDGLDPDELIRERGADAMEAALGAARPLVDVLWEREWRAGDWSTPERQARLEAQLGALTDRIEDAAVRTLYKKEMRRRLAAAFGEAAPQGEAGGQRPAQGPAEGQGWRGGVKAARERGQGQSSGPGKTFVRGGSRRWPPSRYDIEAPAMASSSLRQSRLVAAEVPVPPREALLVRTLLNHPWLVEVHAEEIASMPLLSGELSRLRDAILSAQAVEIALDRTALRSQLSGSDVGRVVEAVDRACTHKSDKFAEPEAEKDEVEVGWRHALALQVRQMGLRQELAAAERAWHEDGSEEALARICDVQRQLSALAASDVDTTNSAVHA